MIYDLTYITPPLPTSLTDAGVPLGYRVAMIRLRAKSPSTSHTLPPPIIVPHTRASMVMMRVAAPSTYSLAPRSETPASGTPPLLPIPLATSSPSLFYPLLLPTKGFKADYGFVDSLDFEIRRNPDREIDFVTTVRHDTDEIYKRLDDAQDDRLLMSAPTRRTTRASLATITTTTLVKNAQLKALIDQDVANALAARDVDRSRDGDYSNNSGTGSRMIERTTRECTYTDFLKFQPMNFKGIEGVVGLTQWSVMASKPKTMQDAVEFETELSNKKIRTFAERQTENKRKFKDALRNNQNQQQQNKRYNTSRAYTVRSGEKKPYGGSKPMCSKCNYHHDGLCAPKCHKCNRVGHLARDCKSPINANTANNQRDTRAGQKATSFECGAQGHFKRECPKLKNNNHGNQGRNGNAPAKVYLVRNVGTNPSSNVVTGTFLLNNHYDSILFDTGVDRCFMSTAFSS
nr:hypothetical protein [Tanacetum cinerariifolium]